jgi:ABC-type amino acid transport substrate-binding protein
MTSLRSRRPAVRIALPVSLALLTGVLAACGSSSSGASSDSATTTAAAGSADATLAAELPDSIKSSKQISFGALWETPPVISVTTTNTSTPVGVAPDLAAALAPVLGVSVKWQNMQWPAQLPGVQSGAVNALFGQVSATADRETSVVDLIPFYRSSMALLMTPAKANGVTGLASMCGKKIGVPVGSIQSDTVKAVSKASCTGNDIKLAEYSGATAAISAVRAGTVDAWMDSTTSQKAVVAKAGSTFTDVEIPDSEFAPQYTTIAVSKTEPGLTKALLGAMQKIVADGSYAKIMEKYDLKDAEITSDELVVNPVTKTPIGQKSAS